MLKTEPKFFKQISTGSGTVRISNRDGSIWLRMDDAEGDFEAIQSLSKEAATELAGALLSAING